MMDPGVDIWGVGGVFPVWGFLGAFPLCLDLI